QQIDVTAYDPNIQVPALLHVYRTPGMTTRDARVLDMIATILSTGKSSRLYKKLVDDKKMALEVMSLSFSQEDYGMYITFALPIGNTSLADLTREMDEEITRIQTELISEREYEKMLNVFENNFVDAN